MPILTNMIEIKLVVYIVLCKMYCLKEMLPNSMMTWAGEEGKCIQFLVWCSTCLDVMMALSISSGRGQESVT